MKKIEVLFSWVPSRVSNCMYAISVALAKLKKKYAWPKWLEQQLCSKCKRNGLFGMQGKEAYKEMLD